MKRTVAHLFGEEVARATSDIWDLDAEGELRGVYRPTGHPALWFAAGGFDHARYLSKFLVRVPIPGWRFG